MTGNAGWFAYDGADINAVYGLNYKYLPYNTTTTPNSYDSIQVISEGSSVNGPNSGSFARTISMFKKDFGTAAAKGGEMDALYIVLRQDGRDGVQSDGCGILVDVEAYDNPGFVGIMEGAFTQVAKATNTISYRVNVQIGCADYATGEGAAFYGKAAVSCVKDGLHLVAEGNAFFQYWLRFQSPDHTVYSLDKNGLEAMASFASGSTVWRYVDSQGTLHIVNNTQSVDLLLLDQAGNMQLNSALDLKPTAYANRPAIKQGRIWFNASTGQLMICRDNASWSAL